MGLQYKKASPAFDHTAFDDTDDDDDDDDDELAALVDSFYDGGSDFEQLMKEESEVRSNNGTGDLIGMLDELMEEMDDEPEVGRIRVEVERAVRAIGRSAAGRPRDHEDRFFKERVVDRLRKRGYDASTQSKTNMKINVFISLRNGLCKSSGEQSDGSPAAGSHKYIDVITRGKTQTRYIVEPNLPCNFEIARPSNKYTRVFRGLPEVFVGRSEHLKCIVRIMSTAAVESMRSAGMHLPPWRRREYVLAKWFSSYKRAASFGFSSVKIEKKVPNVRHQG